MFEIDSFEFDESKEMLLAADRLERLAAHLRAIDAGLGPTERDLANAPVIENWSTEFFPVKALFGQVAENRQGRQLGFFSPNLWILAERRGWALTLEHLYRLGQPEDPGK